MEIPRVHQQAIDDFFAEIAPLCEAYSARILSFAAFRNGESFELLHATLTLSAETHLDSLRRYETADILCAEISLHKIGLSPNQVLKALIDGALAMHDVVLRFAPNNPGSYSVHHRAFDGTKQGQLGYAGGVLLTGANDEWQYIQPPRILQQVKSGLVPYEDVSALGADFGLRLGQGYNRTFEIRAMAVGAIADGSRISDTQAAVEIRLPIELDPAKARVGLQITGSLGVTRTSKSLDEFMRSEANGHQLGRLVLDLEPSSEIACVLSYAGLPQHEINIVHANSRGHPLQAIYELFDKNRTVLQRIVESRKLKHRDPHELELAVGAILAMQGFSVIQIGSLPDLSDAPDIVAATLSGDLLIVECTLDLPHAADKLSKLHTRALEIERTLADRNDKARIVPILAVSKPLKSLGSDPDQARNYGILLWSMEDLERLSKISREPDPTALFTELWSTVADGDVDDL